MTRHAMHLTLAALLLSFGLAGCGVQQKAEFSMLLDAHSEHPEFVRAAARSEQARLLALMRLTPAQARTFSDWAAEHGGPVRDGIDAAFVKMAGSAGAVSAAGDELVATRIDTVAGQDRYMDAKLGDQADLAAGNGKPVDMEALLEPHLASLAPLASALTDRQVLVLTGEWQDASEQVASVLTAEPDGPELESYRQMLQSAIVSARGGDPDGTVQAKVEPLVNAIKAGRADASTADAEVARLFAAVKPQADYDPLAVAAPALATVLCQPSTVELLALVPAERQASRPRGPRPRPRHGRGPGR